MLPFTLTQRSGLSGRAPPRWGRFDAKELPGPMPPQMVLAPPVLNAGASLQSVAQAELVRKAHPLYSDVALRLLVEILNGRLFTTVSRDAARQGTHVQTVDLLDMG